MLQFEVIIIIEIMHDCPPGATAPFSFLAATDLQLYFTLHL
jgi:hypothetical protein